MVGPAVGDNLRMGEGRYRIMSLSVTPTGVRFEATSVDGSRHPPLEGPMQLTWDATINAWRYAL